MQIISYIVVVLLFVVFTFCILPALPLTTKVRKLRKDSLAYCRQTLENISKRLNNHHCHFPLFLSPFILPIFEKILAGILFYLSYAAIIALGYLCTVFDPTDSVVIKEKTARLNK